MFKKIGIAALSAVLVLGLSSCGGGSDYGENFDKFNAAIDMDFAKEVMMSVSEFGDDPVRVCARRVRLRRSRPWNTSKALWRTSDFRI